MTMTNIFNVRIQNKRDAEDIWEAQDPVLLDGESIIVDLPSGGFRRKTGDGVSKYSELPFDDNNVDARVAALETWHADLIEASNEDIDAIFLPTTV